MRVSKLCSKVLEVGKVLGKKTVKMALYGNCGAQSSGGEKDVVEMYTVYRRNEGERAGSIGWLGE